MGIEGIEQLGSSQTSSASFEGEFVPDEPAEAEAVPRGVAAAVR